MMVPSVHLNGTSRDELIRLNLEALETLASAREAVSMAGPNGRDFYVQGPDAILIASREHKARLDKLLEVENELRAIVEAI